MTTELYDALFKDTKIVAYARFNKARRLSKRTWWSLFSISSLSIVLILLSIFEKTSNVSSVQPFFIEDIYVPNWIFTVTTSLITLVLSITLSSARLDVEVEKLNDSAIRINKISRSIEAKKNSLSKTDYEKSLQEYNDVISDNRVNHDKVDYVIAKNNINKSCSFEYFYQKNIYQHLELVHYYIIAAMSLSAAISILHKVITTTC